MLYWIVIRAWRWSVSDRNWSPTFVSNKVLCFDGVLSFTVQCRLVNSSHCIEIVTVLWNVDKYLQSTYRNVPEDSNLQPHCRENIRSRLIQCVSGGKLAIVWENVPHVKLHRYCEKYPYSKLNSRGDNDARIIRYSCSSSYSFLSSAMRYPYIALIRPAADAEEKPCGTRVLCKVFGTLMTIFLLN